MPDSNYLRRKHLILNLIHALGPISRTALVSLTDYRPATVGELVKELLDEQLIVETGLHTGGPGRKRVMLEINRDRLCAIGIAFQPNTVLCLVARIDGSILLEASLPIPAGQNKSDLIAELSDYVTQLLQEKLVGKEVIGIGICYPLYDPTAYHTEHTILTNYAHFNDWIDEGLVPTLKRATGVPVQTFSAVTLPAIAEQSFGVAKGVRDFVCIEMSNGFGSSICCNGTAVAGSRGVAGELGHTVIDMENRDKALCYCGKPGCIETAVAYPALAAELRAALKQGVLSSLHGVFDRKGSFTVQDIRQALDEGDRMCLYYVRRVAAQMGTAIANMVNILNPEMVVLFGFMLELGDCFLRELEHAIRDNVLTLSQNFEIRISASPEEIRPLGAVAQLFASFLNREDFKWVYQLENENWEEYASLQKENGE